MPKPKLQIIVLFQNLGEERPYYAKSPSPPLSVCASASTCCSRAVAAPTNGRAEAERAAWGSGWNSVSRGTSMLVSERWKRPELRSSMRRMMV